MTLTLKDIAEMVGVAESTVSRAVNNKPGVGDETRQKIMEIVKKYNFRPNQMARGLAKKETGILALLIPDLTEPAYPEIIKGIEKVANDEGYQVILCHTENDLEKEKSYLQLLQENRVDGAIIAGGGLADQHILNTSLRGNNLIVLINSLAEELLLPSVLINYSRGVYLAAEHLLQQNVDKIGLIMGDFRDYVESEKLSGYQQALKKYEVEYDNDYVVETDGKYEDGYKAFLQFMNMDDPPRGFLATNEYLTTGLVEAIKGGGYFIPGDFKVATYGESRLISLIAPGLTVVSEPRQQLGETAAEIMIDLIRGESPSELIKVLEPFLKVENKIKEETNNG